MNKYEFKNISIRGRVAFAISCLVNYINANYPDSDFSSVIDLACKITEEDEYIDISTMTFMEILPEYLYEFDNYGDAEFEYITEDQYQAFTKLIPRNDTVLNSIMLAIRNIAWEYCYVAMEPGAPATYPYIEELITTMIDHSLPLPKVNNYTSFAFDENEGWGRHINRKEYL